MARCGTPSGYDRHRRKGEPTCRPCKDAQAAKTRERYWRLRKPSQPRRDAAQCGTRSGYARHLRTGERACAACRAAENGHEASRDAFRRTRW